MPLHMKRHVTTCVQPLQSIFQGEILQYLLRYLFPEILPSALVANWAAVNFLDIFSKQDAVVDANVNHLVPHAKAL